MEAIEILKNFVEEKLSTEELKWRCIQIKN